MQNHIGVVHEDYKPFMCSVCEYRALKAAKLRVHIAEEHRDNKNAEIVEITRDESKFQVR